MLAGLWLLVLAVLASCQSPVAVVANPPASLEGTWEGHYESAPLLLLFSKDGEFRLAANADRLFESPWLVGRYQYEDGVITFYNGGIASRDCRLGGHYAIVVYTSGEVPEMTLMQQDDACDSRHDVFQDSLWVLPAGEG